MRHIWISAVLLAALAAVLFTTGCAVRSVSEPESLSVSDISFSDISVSDIIVSETEAAEPPAEVFLPADFMDMCAGTYSDIEVTVVRSDGSEEIRLASSDEDIIKVVDGRLLAVNTGKALVTADIGTATDNMLVTVSDSRLAYAKELITALAYNADKTVPDKVTDFADALKQCKLSNSAKYAQLLLDMLDVKVSGNAKTLGISTSLLRQACVSVWAMKQQEKHDVVMSFTGDCTFGRFNERSGKENFPYVYKNSGSVTYPFDNVRGVFSADDLTVINFEGTLTDSKQHAEKPYYFRGEQSYADILVNSSVEAVNLANNHTYDYFQKGFDDTVAAMNRAKIANFSSGSASFHKLQSKDGSMINVVLLSTVSTGKYSKESFDVLRGQIKKYKADNTIIAVSLHWGIELNETPSSWQIRIAHKLVEEGADIIIGHHPHILQGIECYKGAYIAYSLGNFAFGGNTKAPSPQTVILRAGFDLKGGKSKCTGLYVVPCHITSTGNVDNDYKPSMQFGDNAKQVINLLRNRSDSISGVNKFEWCKL